MEMPTSKQESQIVEQIRSSIILLFNERRSSDSYVLLLQRPNIGILANMWELPGGKTEHGMESYKSVLEEVLQETGLVIPLERLEYLTMRQRAGEIQETSDRTRNRTIITHPFFYKVDVDSLPEIHLSEEHQDYLWFNLGDNYRLQRSTPISAKRYQEYGTNRAGFSNALTSCTGTVPVTMVFTPTAERNLFPYIIVHHDDDYMDQRRPVIPELCTRKINK